MIANILARISMFWRFLRMPANPLEYRPVLYPGTREQRQEELRRLEEESSEFIREIGGRLPHQWTLGEGAWYESIRRREATI